MGIFFKLLELLRQEQPCILATVVETAGSAPQTPGSSALIGKQGLIAGTVGGGQAEYQVISEALKALETGISKIIHLDMSGNFTEESDTICGGKMAILIDSSPGRDLAQFEKLRDSMLKHIPGTLLTLIEGEHNSSLYIKRLWTDKEENFISSNRLSDEFQLFLKENPDVLKPGEFRKFTVYPEQSGGHAYLYMQPVFPPPSLVIAGAGHVGKAVAHLGKFLGFEITVWDDRSEFASLANIPDADFIFTGPAEKMVSEIMVKEDSYLVIVTRGHKNDAEVLREWIKTAPAYLGMMGSKTKVSRMKQQFLEEGWATPSEWERVHTPIGIKINSETVEEIAVSIIAELIQVKNSRIAQIGERKAERPI